jgi:predicted O-methyltransferase YrrM
MKFNEIEEQLRDIPHISAKRGRILYDLIIKNKNTKILELGFAHGTSTCYIAAALDEIGKGEIITIDNLTAKKRKPNIHQLLENNNLHKYILPIFANKSYNWELMKIIEQQTKDGVCTPIFDFCFIDGAHSFETDGLAFFLADKLLKPGSWLLFDDYYWTYGKSPSLKKTKFVKAMAEDEKTMPQIKQVFELLVRQHQNYTDLKLFDDWAWARKKQDENDNSVFISEIEEIYKNADLFEEQPRTKSVLKKIKRKLIR